MSEKINLRVIVIGLIIALLLQAFIVILLDDVFIQPKDRYREKEEANEASILVFWQNGTDANIDLNEDLRVPVVTISFILFISIFANLMMHNKGGIETDE